MIRVACYCGADLIGEEAAVCVNPKCSEFGKPCTMSDQPTAEQEREAREWAYLVAGLNE